MQSSSTPQNGRVRRSESEWRDLMHRFTKSGRSRAAFCRAEGISRSTFDLWQRKLREAQSAPQLNSGDFVELVSSESPAAAATLESRQCASPV